jgi:cysteine desulfurase
MSQSPIYLDYNATTPVHPEVLQSMLPYFSEKFGNASSKTHSWGWTAEAAVEKGREQLAALIGAETNEIIFTSGATEAINLALKGAFEIYRHQRDHIVTVATEHKAVLDTCNQLEKLGARITYIPVLADGMISLDALQETVTEKTLVVSVMMANNETGVVHPMRDIAAIAHQKGAFFFSDTTQAIGKLRIDVEEEGIDLCCLSAHKFYAPKGIGALYARRKNPRVQLSPQLVGGGHENNRRSGTLNVPGIVGMGAAAELALNDWWSDAGRISVLRTQLEQCLMDLGGVTVNGNTKFRLPNTTNLCFHGHPSATLIRKLSGLGVATGSACTSALQEPSHVLRAMGINDEDAYSSLRFSLGKFTTEEEIEQTIKLVQQALEDVY